MNRDEYVKYIRYTIGEYNSYKKKKLFSLLKKEKIITTEEKTQISFLDQDSIEVSELDIYEALLEATKKSDRAIEIYQKFQFFDHYKYSAIFTSDNFKQIVDIATHISTYKFSNDVLYNTFKDPKKLLVDDKIVIKFNRKYMAIHPQTREEMFLDYPILLVIHTNEKIIEIRLDSISGFFVENNTQLIYTEIIRELMDYMKEQWDIQLQPLDIELIRDELKEHSNIKIIAQSMNMFEGSKAQLSVGNNTNYVMPFIGELQEIISENENEFKKSPIIKSILENFIEEKEKLTEYPWIEIEILGNTKNRNIKEKFIFNYMNQGYCVIQHYNNSVVEGMERMNSVVRYINKCVGEKKGE